MDDLLQSQIRNSCSLALPEGLKDLMSDISREVLRAQPKDLYGFITGYLSSLMVVRENIHVAVHICNASCDNVCHLSLEDEFKKLGLTTKQAMETAELVKEYFEKGPVIKECNLITKLMNETTLEEQYLPQIQRVVRDAVLQHQGYAATGSSESSSNSEMDEVTRATRHTLHLYKKTQPTHEECVRAAVTIQAAYRANKVRRHVRLRDRVSNDYQLTIETENFAEFCNSTREEAVSTRARPAEHESQDTKHIGQPYIATASSTSLAGSFVKLPKYRPYNAHLKEILSGLEELPEKEHATIDYTQEHPHRVFTKQSKDSECDESKRTIKFQETAFEVVEDAAEAAVDSQDESIEEVHEIHDMRGSSNETD